MNAPAVMIAANARLSTSVTANWRVKPTAAMASTADVIRPNPTEARKRLTARSPPGAARGGSPGHRAQLARRDGARHPYGAGRAVGVDLEDPRRIVEGIEAGRAARPDVPDLLARLERGRALGERVDDHGARHAV